MTYSLKTALRIAVVEGRRLYPAPAPTASGVAKALSATGYRRPQDVEAAMDSMAACGYTSDNEDYHTMLADVTATVAAQKWRFPVEMPKLLLTLPGLGEVRLAQRGSKKLRARALMAESAIGHAFSMQVSADGHKLWSRHCDSNKLTEYIHECAVAESSVVSMGIITDDVSSRFIEGTPVLLCKHRGYASWFRMDTTMEYPDTPTKTLAAVIDRGPKSFGALSKSTAWNWE